MSCVNLCGDGHFAQNQPKIELGAKIAATVTVVALAVIAGSAFLHLGVFAQNTQLAGYLGVGTTVGAGILSIGLIIYIVYSCKRHSSSIEQKGIDTYRGKVYSPNRPASEKLSKQLRCAVLEGKQFTKNSPMFKFTLDFDFDDEGRKKTFKTETCKEFVDESIHLEGVGAAEKQGRRSKMEDAHVACSLTLGGEQAFLYGVFDGHGDDGNVAGYVRDNLPKKLEEKLGEGVPLTDETVTNAITAVCIELDEETAAMKGGTTATFSIRFADRLYTANVGDSRAVLMHKSRDNFYPYQLSEDADPTQFRFYRGIRKMGYEVFLADDNCYRIRRFESEGKGGLNLARDIGGKTVSPRPKITRIDLDVEMSLEKRTSGFSEGDYLVLACDGFWDVAHNGEAAQAIKKMEEEEMDVRDIAGGLTGLAKFSGDNVTVLVVHLS